MICQAESKPALAVKHLVSITFSVQVYYWYLFIVAHGTVCISNITIGTTHACTILELTSNA
jgi:hypothetical protein